MKWNLKKAVLQAQAALRHKDIVGLVECGHGGFGPSTSQPL